VSDRVLVSLGEGSQERLLELARPTFERYARAFGYDLDLRTRGQAHGRPPAWSKVAIIRELLDRYEHVVWIDADAVVVDFGRDIVDALAPGAALGLVEHHYDGNRFPNTGVMAIRSGDQARSFWSDVWSRTEFIDHPWWENAAVCDLLGYRVATWPRRPGETLRDWPWRHSLRHAAWHLQCRAQDHLGLQILRVVPKRGAPPPFLTLLGSEWNSIAADPSSSPRIKHYPGEPLEDRAAKMAADVAALSG
jgi:nucleotide-diphospho-sugar transferase